MTRVRVLAILVVLLAGCVAPGQRPNGPSSVPSMSPTPAPTATSPASSAEAPSIGPTLSTTAPTGPSWTPRPSEPLLYGSAIRPIVAELNVRDGPSLAAKSWGVVTPKNVLVVNVLQFFEADGYRWYRGTVVSATGELPDLPEIEPSVGEPLTGWIAVAKGANAYVERLAPRCPSSIDLWNVAAMLESELLACFGDHSIVLEGVFGCGGCGGDIPGTYEPAWLAHPFGFGFGLLSVAPLSAGRWGALVGHAPPTGPAAPPQGSIIRVRGHFDDESATTCEIALPLPGDPSDAPALVPVDQASATLLCRQRFVVESYEILGADPDFILG